MKIVMIVGLLIIVASLAFALFFMMKDKGKSRRMVNALSVRIGLSVALFVLILWAYQMGWLHSTGIPY